MGELKQPPGSYLRDPVTFIDSGPLPSLFVFDLDYTLWPLWVDTHIDPPIRPTYASDIDSDGDGSDLDNNTENDARDVNQRSMPWDRDAGKSGRRRKTKKQKESSDKNAPRPVCARTVTDKNGSRWTFYPEVGAIFAAIKRRGIQIAIASRTTEDVLATKMLRALKLHTPIIDDDTNLNLSPESYSYTTTPAISLIAQSEIYPTTKKIHMEKLRDGLGIAYEDFVFYDDEPRNFDVEKELGVTMFLLKNDDGVTLARIDEGVRKWRIRKAEAERSGSAKRVGN